MVPKGVAVLTLLWLCYIAPVDGSVTPTDFKELISSVITAEFFIVNMSTSN